MTSPNMTSLSTTNPSTRSLNTTSPNMRSPSTRSPSMKSPLTIRPPAVISSALRWNTWAFPMSTAAPLPTVLTAPDLSSMSTTAAVTASPVPPSRSTATDTMSPTLICSPETWCSSLPQTALPTPAASTVSPTWVSTSAAATSSMPAAAA